MRKSAIALGAGLIGLSTAFSGAALAAGEDWVARVKRMSGTVSLETNGVAAPVAIGDRLPPDAVLVTGPAGSVGLTFRDNTRTALGPNARMKLSRYAFEPGQSNADAELETDLSAGAAAFVSGRVTKSRPGAMKVRTPAALLGVRGTTFIALTGESLDK